MTTSNENLSALVPAHVNGTLSEPERIAVEKAAQENPALAAEIEACRKIAYALKTNPAKHAEVGEFAWRRLERDINKEISNAAPPNTNQPFWRYAAAALGVIALAQTIALTVSFNQDDAAVYATAGASPIAPFTAKVDFNDDARSVSIDALLKEIQGEIVSGPSARGLYQVSFETKDAHDKALTVFAERGDVVTLAAPE